MKYTLILVCIVVHIPVINLFSQTAFWAKGFSAANCDYTITDESGIIYTAGIYTDTLEIEGEVIAAANEYSSWIGKFNPTGELVWLKNITASGAVVVLDLKMNNSGELVICGYSRGLVDFGPLLSGNIADIFARGFVAVSNSNGTCTKVTSTNGESETIYTSVAINSEGKYAVAGFTEGEFHFGAFLVNFYGEQDGIYGLYDAALSPLWMKTIGGPGSDACAAIQFDNDDEPVIAGFFDGNFMLTDVPFISQGGTDLFVVNADADGFFDWYRTMGSENEETQYWMDLAIDSDNNIYFASNMVDEMYYPGGYVASYGGTDPFITKFDADGNSQWLLHGGGSDYDILFGMKAGLDDNFYLYGNFYGAAEFDGLVLFADEESDGFFCEVGNNGAANLVAQTDGDGAESISSISIDPYHNLIMAGLTTGNINFEGVGEIEQIGAEGTTFLAKYETVYSLPEVGISNLIPGNQVLYIYPNPAAGITTIDLLNFPFIEKLCVTNSAGRQVMTEDVNGQSNIKLNFTGLPEGIYLLSGMTSDGSITQTQKLIVANR